MLGKLVVYLDILLLINLIMNYVILWTTARLTRLNTSGFRLLISSCCGVVWFLIIFLFPDSVPASNLLKAVIPLAMIILAFYPVKWKKYVQALVYFYLISFAIGGSIIAAIYVIAGITERTLLGESMSIPNINYYWLLIGIIIAFVLGQWGSIFIKKHFLGSMFHLPVIVCVDNKKVPLKALVDTGNRLRDPLSQKPVIIVEYDALKQLFPKDFCALFESKESSFNDLVFRLSNSEWASRFRLIPFSSIGKNRGMLCGFRPDEIIIVLEEKPIKIHDVIVAIYDKPLSPEKEYRALLHPELLEAAYGA